MSDSPAVPSRSPRSPIVVAILIALLAGFAAGVVGYIAGPDVEDSLGIDHSSSSSNSSSTLPAPVGERAGDRSSEGDSNPKSVNDIYEQVKPGVVHVSVTQTVVNNSIFGFGEEQKGQASGSGFLIDDEGHLVTNAHVVDGADEDSIKVSFSNEKEFSAKLVGADVSSDIAVLKVDAPKRALVPLEYADSSKLEVGDAVVAIGNPFNLDRTATTGIVSALQREIEAPNGFVIDDVIQTDAAINPGNSGGPLLDMEGRVIGVNSQIQSPSGGNVGIGFAIPSKTVKRVADQLIKSGSVARAYLGVIGTDIDSEIAASLNLPVKKGVLLADVAKRSPAGKAGLKAGNQAAVIDGETYSLGGDIIVKFDGKDVTSMRQLVGLVGDHDAGDKVDIEYYRGTKRKKTSVTLVKRPEKLDVQQ
jgi:S1-C subfamily serine protease